VNNVVDSSATDAAKAEAVADIEAALAAGWSQGKVIYTIFSNLAAKDPADATWGATATLMANQVAVAKYYTEEQLGNATSVTALQSVISAVTASTDVSSNTALAAAITAGVDPVVTVGQTFTLTTSVDAVSGGAGDDVISGLLGTSGTYTVGDNIDGNSGSDTLNLVAGTGTDGDGGLVSIDAVETINVRNLATAYASAGDEVSLNAADWVGVVTLTNASSLVNTVLDVSGLTDDTVVVLYGNTDINVGYNNTTTGATANAVLVNAGSAGTATTIGSASATNTANFDFDEAGGGLVTHVNLEVRGSLNLARLDGDGSGMTYTITGTGNAALVSDDLISVFNASAAQGNIDMTFSGASDVAFTGGVGNDTVRLGTTISNNDSINGGAGTDLVTVTMGGFNRTLNASAVETATLTFDDDAGGTLTFGSASEAVTTVNLSTGSAGADANVAGVGNGAVVNAQTDNYDAVTIDFASGATTATINLGSAGTATADVAFSGLYVTDVAAITVAGVSMTSAGATADVTTATFDSDVKSIVYSIGGSGSLEVGNGGDASLGGATSLTFNAYTAANINFDSDIAGTAALTTLSVNTFGNTAASATLVNISGTALTTISLAAQSAGDITVGTVALGNGSKTGVAADVTVNISQGVEADVALGAISTTGGMSLTINASTIGSSGSTYIADLVVDKGTDGSTTGLTQTVTLGAMTVGTGASFELEAIDLEAATAGAQVNIGAITVQRNGDFDLGSASGISAGAIANVDISNISLTVETSGSATFGVISTSGGAVGQITVNVGTAASAIFGTVTASAIGAISVMASGSTAATAAEVDFGNMTSESTIGAIEIAGEDAANVTFGTLGASGSIGAIAASGAVDVVIGVVTAPRIGTISTTGQNASGSFQIDLSGVTNAVEVNLGVGANTIVSGDGNDVITLTAGRTAVAGNDTIRYVSSTDGLDNIINFIAGNAASGGDQIELDVSEFDLALRDGDGSAIGAAVSDLTVAISGATTIGATDNIIVLTTAFATTATMLNFVDSEITFATALAGSGNAVVVWTNGSDSYLSLIDFDVTGGETTLASGSAALVVNTLAEISGVTPGAMVAANFEFV